MTISHQGLWNLWRTVTVSISFTTVRPVPSPAPSQYWIPICWMNGWMVSRKKQQPKLETQWQWLLNITEIGLKARNKHSEVGQAANHMVSLAVLFRGKAASYSDQQRRSDAVPVFQNGWWFWNPLGSQPPGWVSLSDWRARHTGFSFIISLLTSAKKWAPLTHTIKKPPKLGDTRKKSVILKGNHGNEDLPGRARCRGAGIFGCGGSVTVTSKPRVGPWRRQTFETWGMREVMVQSSRWCLLWGYRGACSLITSMCYFPWIFHPSFCPCPQPCDHS